MSCSCQNKVEDRYIIGVVVDCYGLDIYKEPDENSETIITVPCLDELCIDTVASTDEWYSVCTVVGIEGFCKKKYVAIRQ